MPAFFSQTVYNGIRKRFPSLVLMRTGLMSSNRKRGVEQQNTLGCPPQQITAGRSLNTQVRFKFLEDIDQRRRVRGAILNRKAQTVCLSGFVIGILPQNHHFNLVERASIKSLENMWTGRIYGCTLIFLLHKSGKLTEVILLKLSGQSLFPAFFYFDIHVNQY